MRNSRLRWSLLLPVLLVFSRNNEAQTSPPPLLPPTGFQLDTEIGIAPEEQRSPAVSHGLNQSLVVWYDERAEHSSTSFGGSPDIYGARLDDSGALIDAVSIPIVQGSGLQQYPDVAWNGSAWLVAWYDQRASTPDIMAARIDPTGTVLDPIGTKLNSPNASASSPAVVSDGINWIVIWVGQSGTTLARRVAPNGTLLDPSPVTLDTIASSSSPRAAFSSGVLAVTWSITSSSTNTRAVVVRRYNAQLQALDPAPLVVADSTTRNEEDPNVAASPTGFYIAFRSEGIPPDTARELRGARMPITGGVTDPGGTKLSDQTESHRPSVAWSGTQWFVGWAAGGKQKAVRVSSSSGTPLDEGVPVASSAPYPFNPAMDALSGGRVLSVWTNREGVSSTVLKVARSVYDSSGNPNEKSLIGLGMKRQDYPRLISRGPDLLMLYSRTPETPTSGVLQRLDYQGRPIGAPVEGPFSGAQVAWDGQRYLVGWGGPGWGFFQRFTAALTPIDTVPRPAPDDRTPAALAGANGRFMFFTSYGTGTPPNYPNYSQVLFIDGATGLETSVRRDIDQGDRFTSLGGFTAAWADGRWLLAWEKAGNVRTCNEGWDSPTCNLTGNGLGFAGSRPGLTGRADDALMTCVFANDKSVHAQTWDAVVHNWSWLNTPLSGALPDVHSTQAAWNGSEYLVAFTSDSPGATSSNAAYEAYDVLANRVMGRQVLDGTGFPIAADPRLDEDSIAIASTTFGAVVLYTRMDAASGARRLTARRLDASTKTPGPIGGVVATSKNSFGWTADPLATSYDVLRGVLSHLLSDGSIGRATCFADNVIGTNVDDSANPATGDGWYYLVRADLSNGYPGSYDDAVSSRQTHNRDADLGLLGSTVCTP